jgi:hypothetical protein
MLGDAGRVVQTIDRECSVYELYIANKNYSSRPLQPWLLLSQLDIPFDERLMSFAPGTGSRWCQRRPRWCRRAGSASG